MKAVFLDYATVGSADLDLSPLTDLFPDIEFYDATAAAETAARIADAEVVFVNKVKLTGEIIAGMPKNCA